MWKRAVEKGDVSDGYRIQGQDIKGVTMIAKNRFYLPSWISATSRAVCHVSRSRISASLLFLTMLLQICSAASADIPQAGDANDMKISQSIDPGMTEFGWASCKAIEKPLFVVRISSAGHLTFIGLAESRELGSRESSLSKPQLARTLKAASAFLVSRNPASGETPKEDGARAGICLFVRTGAPSNQSAFANYESAAAARFNKAVGSATSYLKFACPGRGLSSIARSGACGSEVLSMVYEQSKDCRIKDNVEIFESGAVHFFQYPLSGSDQYADIGRKKARQLERLARKFSVVAHEGLEGGAQQSLLGNGAELLEFRKKLTEYTGLTQPTISPNDSRCVKASPDLPLQRWISF